MKIIKNDFHSKNKSDVKLAGVIKNTHLGNTWGCLSYFIQNIKDDEIFIGQRHNKTTLLNEIIPLFDTEKKLTVVNVDTSIDYKTLNMLDVAGLPKSQHYRHVYARTKEKWQENHSKKVCYQIDAGHAKHRKSVDADSRKNLFDMLGRMGYKFVELGKHFDLRECVSHLASCEFFVGVDSGFAHVAHSVGTPRHLLRCRTSHRKMQAFHGSNSPVIHDSVSALLNTIYRQNL